MGEENIREDIYRPVVEQGSWKMRTNQELCELYKDFDIVTDIKNRRLKWVGQVARMDQGRVVKILFQSKPEGRRRMAGPRLRWFEDDENDLWELKVKR
jgi:hypothetical protein